MTDDGPETRPCPDCDADCSVQEYGPNAILAATTLVWVCANNKALGGDCPNETAYLTADAWNRTPADPEPSVVADDGLVAKLEALARQQADGTDFHNGRKLTAEDTMYWKAAALMRTLQSRIEPSDGWQPIGPQHERMVCVGVFVEPLAHTSWVGPIIGTVRDGRFTNNLGAWDGMSLIMPIQLPPSPAIKDSK